MTMQDVPMPTLGHDTDVLIRMERMGICGSDVHYFAEGGIGSQRVVYPWGVGHEGSGTVEKVGTAVTRIKPGDRVAFDPALPCGSCDQCLAGRPHTCRAQKFLGCPGQIEGCLAEYLVLPERNCYPIPNAMTLGRSGRGRAAFHRHLCTSQLCGRWNRGATLGVLGAGPIGLSVLLPAKAQGASRVYVTDKIDARLEMATRAGADWVGNPDTGDVVAEISSREPELLDAVFECSGQQDAMDQALQILKPGGKLLLIGIPSTNRVSFDVNLLRRKELIIQNVRRQNDCVQRAIDMIASKEIDVSVIVTHHIPFAQSQHGFDMVADYQDGVVKAMVTF